MPAAPWFLSAIILIAAIVAVVVFDAATDERYRPMTMWAAFGPSAARFCR